jgi:NAD-dependent SIR2 family protein deacetylase
MPSDDPLEKKVELLRAKLDECESVLVGAGAGVSSSAGYDYSGPRFDRYFADFRDAYGIRDMYSGGFWRYPDDNTFWAWWSRAVYLNRYVDPPRPVYRELLELLRGKDYFVITTNVDHCFQKAGFDKERLFYTQGDYGLFQCSKPCSPYTYENGKQIAAMMEAQGFVRDQNGIFVPPEKGLSMKVPDSLLPRCPVCGRPMMMNLRIDGRFVEDKGWNEAKRRYTEWTYDHGDGRILYLELGVGENTPVIIKWPMWRRTAANRKAFYACVNLGNAYAPEGIAGRSVCIDADIGDVIEAVSGKKNPAGES